MTVESISEGPIPALFVSCVVSLKKKRKRWRNRTDLQISCSGDVWLFSAYQ